MALKTITLELDGSTRRARKAKRAFDDGWAHQKARRWREAVDCYTAALAIDRTMFPAWANRGMCWHQLGKPVEALSDYGRAFAIGTPDLQRIIRVNRGVLLSAVRRYDEALEDFAADPSPEARLNAAYIHLMRGEFWQGLELYRERPTVKQWRAKVHRLDDLRDKTVLILHEQGFGDSIMMARFVPQIVEVARAVHWTTRTALMPLLAANLPGVTFSDGGDVKAAALVYQHDAFVLVMDVWQTCGLEIDGRSYLKADPARAAAHHSRLRVTGKRLVGLSWRGRVEFSNDHNRSMRFDDLRPLMDELRHDAIFVSLQKDLNEADFNGGPISGMIDAGSRIQSFADTAALMSCLDAVISVDTATAHLAGAMGIPCAVLLPYAADWRWGGSGDTTPWYDSVQLFRQPSFGDWAPAVAAASTWVRCRTKA